MRAAAQARVRLRAWLAGAAIALAGLVAVTGFVAGPSATPSARAAQRSRLGTATVRRQELSATVSEAGTLGFAAQADGAPYTVIDEAQGAYTMLPAAGRVIRQDQVLYRVDDRPVLLLYGSTPAYRTLSSGMTGPDVAELNADLVALGYAGAAQLSPSSATFGTATTTALEKLQAARGIAQTGTLPLGQAVFEPGALRVTALSALLGGAAQMGQPVLQATSTRRQVLVWLDATQQNEVAVGDRVTITLPDNRVTGGVVTSVAKVATCDAGSGSGGSSSAAASAGADSCSSGGPSSSTPTIAVDVTPADPGATGSWDQAPVQVGITTSRVRDALVVPVAALLARAGGGYAVEVAGRGRSNQLVSVSLGLFDDAEGLVQVGGPGLMAGEQVVVPAA